MSTASRQKRTAPRSSLAISAERGSRAELAEERARRHARDGAEVGDEMRLIVVAGGRGDARPARASVSSCSAESAMEARELRERLGAHADSFAEHAAKVALAHAELVGDGAHVGGR